MPIACLITIEPMDLSTGNRVTIYACSANDRRVTGLNGVLWEPAVTQIPSLSVNLWNGDFQAAPDPGNATFAINMTVIKQSFPAADQYLWIGAPVKIWAEEIGTAWPWTQRFLGRVASLTRRDQTLSITAKVETETFAKNVLTATYAGTGGIEGGADVKGRVKPLVIGWAQNVEPVLIDAVNSVYQFSGYGAIEGVTTLYERASDFGASVGDYATYAALVAASIPAGRWGTCLASGLIRLGAPAYGVITGDVRGHRVGGTTPRLTGAVINALATIAGVSAGNLNTTSLTALDSAVPFNVNLVLADQTKFIDIAVRMALACNYQAAISLLGQFFVTAVNPAAGATLTINAQGRASPQVITPPDELDVSLPYWKVILGANRCWRPQTLDEIALAATWVERGLYSGSATYREGNVVSLSDGSRYFYINATASSGNSPPNAAFWTLLSDSPTVAGIVGQGALATQNTARTNQIVAVSGGAAQSDGSLITAQGTAAAIAGQAWAATNGSQAAVDNNYVAGFANQALDSEFTLNNTGWNEGYTSGGTWVWNYFTALTSKRFLERYCLSPTAGMQVNLGQDTFNGLPVVDGDRLELSAIVSWTNMSSAVLFVGYFTAAGVYVTGATVATGSNDTRVGGFVTVPSGLGIGLAKLMAVYTVASAGTTASARLAQPFIRLCSSGQNTLSPYNPGPPIQRAADVTSVNTAAAIAGQTAWATYTAFSPTQVTNPGANLLFNSSFNIGTTGWTVNGWAGPYKAAGDVGAWHMTTNVDNTYLYNADVTKTPVFPSSQYTLQVYAAVNGSATGGQRPFIYIDWHTSSGAYISSSSAAYLPVGAGYTTTSLTVTSPSNAAYGRAVMASGLMATTGGNVYTSKWKLELGGARTPWSDDATNGALYQSGQTLDSLKPAQANADQTSLNTAAGVVGQSAWATYAALTPQQVAQLVPNMIYNPTGVLGLDGWTVGSGSVVGNKGAYSEGYYFYTSSGSNTAPVYFYQDINIAAGQQYTISGDIYASGITVSTGSTWARVYIQWLNGSGAHISYSTVAQVAAGTGWTHVTALGQTAPAGAVTARVFCDVWGSGTYTISNVAWSKVKLQMGSVDTLFTDDASYGARYQSGVSIEALKPAQVGADKTSTNTAAAIAGQAATATNSDYAAVTGTKPPSNATNGAPSGTPVGVISADDVAGTINPGGGVAPNKVTTASIVGNAVTSIANAFASSPVAVAGGPSGLTTVLSATITVASGDYILADFVANGQFTSTGAGAGVLFETAIYVDGVDSGYGWVNQQLPYSNASFFGGYSLASGTISLTGLSPGAHTISIVMKATVIAGTMSWGPMATWRSLTLFRGQR